MPEFVGRERELAALTAVLTEIEQDLASVKPGRCVLVRGRRRIGKSSLVEEFIGHSGAPSVFFTAAAAPADVELAEMVRAVTASDLPDRAAFDDADPGNWSTALRLLAEALPLDRPSIVVIDEVPYLMAGVEGFEGMLQRAWDRELCRKPVLLILIGSDLSMMESLSSYGRPFHQRGREMIVGPLGPADVARMTGLPAAEAFDAALVTGGLPLICSAWRRGERPDAFLARQLADPLSPLLVSAERSLAAEFPDQAQARSVLAAIGSGERTFSKIARAVGGLTPTSLTRATQILVDKRLVAAELPITLQPSRERRYWVKDPYLRFWLTFLQPHLPEIERLRGDLTLERVRRGWTSWRGRAIEPLVRDSLARILPARGLPAAGAIGGFWTRTNDVEIDIVGADRAPVARKLLFVGSIKWLERSPFDAHDAADLARHRERLTDDRVPLVAVSRHGTKRVDHLTVFGPEDLLEASTRSSVEIV